MNCKRPRHAPACCKGKVRHPSKPLNLYRERVRDNGSPCSPWFATLSARMFNYLFEMITRLFAHHGGISAVESRASVPSELRVDPPIGKQPRRQIIDGPRREPAITSANVTYKSAPQLLSAFFPKEDTVRVTRRTSERSSDWSAGTPGSSTTPSSSRPSINSADLCDLAAHTS